MLNITSCGLLSDSLQGFLCLKLCPISMVALPRKPVPVEPNVSLCRSLGEVKRSRLFPAGQQAPGRKVICQIASQIDSLSFRPQYCNKTTRHNTEGHQVVLMLPREMMALWVAFMKGLKALNFWTESFLTKL